MPCSFNSYTLNFKLHFILLYIGRQTIVAARKMENIRKKGHLGCVKMHLFKQTLLHNIRVGRWCTHTEYFLFRFFLPTGCVIISTTHTPVDLGAI